MRITEQKFAIHKSVEHLADLKEKKDKIRRHEERLFRLVEQEVKTRENRKIADELFQKRIELNKSQAGKLVEHRMEFIKSSLNVI